MKRHKHIIYFDPTKLTGPEGYINYKLSGGGGFEGGDKNGGKKGCNSGCLVVIIVTLLILMFIKQLGK